MSKSLKYLVSDIRNIATSGANPINFNIEDKQIIYWINQTRSMLINQSIQKRKDISDVWLQNITCLELTEVDKSECCEIETNCKVLRTVRKIPDTIETNGDNMIIRVELPNGELISKTNSFESKYLAYEKYSKHNKRWYLKNNYIYIINAPYIDKINMVGIFESPEELISFVSCNGSTCFSYNNEYPCSQKMAEEITDIVIKKKVLTFLNFPRDISNDSKVNPEIKTN